MNASSASRLVLILWIGLMLGMTSTKEDHIGFNQHHEYPFQGMPKACHYFLTNDRNQHPNNATVAVQKAAEASAAGGCLLGQSLCKRSDMLLTHSGWKVCLGTLPKKSKPFNCYCRLGSLLKTSRARDIIYGQWLVLKP